MQGLEPWFFCSISAVLPAFGKPRKTGGGCFAAAAGGQESAKVSRAGDDNHHENEYLKAHRQQKLQF